MIYNDRTKRIIANNFTVISDTLKLRTINETSMMVEYTNHKREVRRALTGE